jgi:hypothetical protein
VTPDLPTLTRLGILEGEAGNRAQSDTCCEVTLALMGSTYGETEPIKASYLEARTQQNFSTLLEIIPALFRSIMARV